MSKFRLVAVKPMCKSAGVEYQVDAPYQFYLGVEDYIHLYNIQSWGRYYGLTDEVIDRLYVEHKDQMMNVERSHDYANGWAEEFESTIGAPVDYHLDQGWLTFMKDRLLIEDIEQCQSMGEIVEIVVVDDQLFVTLSIQFNK